MDSERFRATILFFSLVPDNRQHQCFATTVSAHASLFTFNHLKYFLDYVKEGAECRFDWFGQLRESKQRQLQALQADGMYPEGEFLGWCDSLFLSHLQTAGMTVCSKHQRHVLHSAQGIQLFNTIPSCQTDAHTSTTSGTHLHLVALTRTLILGTLFAPSPLRPRPLASFFPLTSTSNLRLSSHLRVDGARSSRWRPSYRYRRPCRARRTRTRPPS
jgi:hypothetical protein